MLYGAENGIADVGRGESVSNFTVSYAFFYYIKKYPVELPYQLISLTVEIFFRIPDLQQNYPGKDPVICIAFDGGPDDFPQFVQGSVDPLQVAVYLDQKLIVVLLEDVVKDIALALEVLVDQSFGDASGDCDV